ncbi:unnamed protein product, partial [Callosobruchus maculatus]
MEGIAGVLKQIKESIKQMNEKLDSVVLEIKRMAEENKELKDRVKGQEERIERLEREIRKKNIVMKGVADETTENYEETSGKIVTILQKMGVSINAKEDIEEVRRLGRYNSERDRPILVKFMKEPTKFTILKNTRNLKGTNVWIDEDYPKEVREDRRKLIPELKEARNRGYRATLRYNKLVINGDIYKA